MKHLKFQKTLLAFCLFCFVNFAVGASAAEYEAVSISASAAAKTPGASFLASWTIKNTGFTSGSCHFRIYLSLDSNISTSDVQVYSSSTPNIASFGGTESDSSICWIPSSTEAGSYYVGLFIDDSEAGNPYRISTSNQRIAVTAHLNMGDSDWVSDSTSYTLSPQQGRWNVFGVSSTTDYDISYGGASSASSGNLCDFVLADGHNGTVSTSQGNVSKYGSTSASAQVELERDALQSSFSWNFSWGDRDVVRPFSVDISSTEKGEYLLTVDMSLSSTRHVWYVFEPQSNGSWKQKSSANFGPKSTNTTQELVDFDETGRWLIVVAVHGGPWGSDINNCSVELEPYEPEFEAVSVSGSGTHLPGANINIANTIENVGLKSSTCSYEIWLSSNTSLGSGDFKIKDTSRSISGENSSSDSDSCTIPQSIPAGDYYVILHIDDNDAGFPATIRTSTPSVTIPQLPPEFEAVSVGAAGTYEPGDTITVQRGIQNVGGQSSTCSYSLYLSSNSIITQNDYLVYSNSVTLNGGQLSSGDVVGTIGNTVPNGDYFVGLYITDSDAGNPYLVASSSKSVKIMKVIMASAEFEAYSVSASGVYMPGEMLRVGRSIENVGAVSDDCSYSIYLSSDSTIGLGDELIYSNSVFVTAGQRDDDGVDGLIPTGIAEGDYFVGLYIIDSDRGDPYWVASGSASVTVSTTPPLFVAVSVDAPSSVDPGKIVSVNAEIQNTGGQAGDCNYSWYLSSDSSISTFDTFLRAGSETIPTGAPVSISDSMVIPSGLSGSYYIGIWISGPNAGNPDSASDQITIGNSPGNPVFEGVSVSASGKFAPGDQILVQSEIMNSGDAGNCDYELYLSTDKSITQSDSLLSPSRTGSIPSQQIQMFSDSLSIPSIIPNGNYYVGLLITDSNKGFTDRVASQLASVTIDDTPTDAIVDALSVTVDGTVIAGKEFTGNMVLQNTGTTSGTCEFEIWFSEDNNLDNGDLRASPSRITSPAISAGATLNITFSATAPTALDGLLYTVFARVVQNAGQNPEAPPAFDIPTQVAPASSGGGDGGGGGCALGAATPRGTLLLFFLSILAIARLRRRKAKQA